MKIIFYTVCAALLLFTAAATTNNNAQATATQMQGLYIFTDCTPVQEYEVLGTIKGAGSLGSAQYTAVRDRLIKKAKKEHPTGTGIILHLNDGGTDIADVIKFK